MTNPWLYLKALGAVALVYVLMVLLMGCAHAQPMYTPGTQPLKENKSMTMKQAGEIRAEEVMETEEITNPDNYNGDEYIGQGSEATQ